MSHSHHDDHTGFFLPRLAISRPVTVVMLFVASLVVGFIAYTRIPLQLLPSGFTPPFLVVTVPTIASTPSDVERQIVEPVEDMLRTVRNVRRVRSRAESNNARFYLDFVDGTDMAVAYNQVRDRLERVRPQLPEESGRWAIWKFDPDEDPLMFVGARITAEQGDPEQVLQDDLVRPLELLPQVSRVDVMGLNPLEVTIAVDDKRANAAGISVPQLANRLRDDNFTMSAGAIDSGEGRYPLRLLADVEDLEALRAMPVSDQMRLDDIAEISIGRPEQQEIYRVDGEEGYILAIYKESSTNTVDSAEAIRAALAALDPLRVTTETFFDQGQVIEGSLSNLTETALWGGVFAVLVLFVFLRRVRMTLVTASAIPLSVLMTLVVMYFTDASLNALSLMGLMLCVGMVVDNSIVVTESIQRRRSLGESPLRAAAAGAGEVGLAIIVATSTTIVVFLPMVLMSGSQTLSFYLGKIGYPVCVALIASLVVSLVFIPLALRYGDAGQAPPRVRAIEAVQDAYARALRWCLGHRATAVLGVVALMASIAIPASRLQQTDQLEANINDVRLFFDFEPAMTYEERYARLIAYENWVVEHRDDLEVRTFMTRMGGMWGTPQIRIFLDDIESRELTRDEVITKIREGLPHLSGSDWRIGWGNPGTEKSVTVDIGGPDSERLAELGRLVARRLRGIDGVLDVLVGEDDARALELRYHVDARAAQQAGVAPAMIGGAIDYALRGRRLGEIAIGSRDVPLWLRVEPASTASRKALENLAVPSALGGPGVPISRMAQGEVVPGYNEITHVDGRTELELQVLTTREDLERLGEEIDRVLAGVELPRGYGVAKGERFLRLQSDTRERNFALTMAIVFVFLLMGVLFESFVLPFVIILSIPFAFLGVYWTLWATGTPFDVMAGVGLIILIGIVVNNAIVLVDRVNALIAARGDRTEALVEAGRVRLRPIVMTALTTIFGLVPMAVGSSAIVGVPYAPLGRTVIGGLLASTVLTLFVVPLFFTLLDDLRLFAAGFLRQRR